MKTNLAAIQYKNGSTPTLITINHNGVKHNAITRTRQHVIRLTKRALVYLPIIFFWLTIIMAATGQLSITYPIQPEEINLSLDTLWEILQPIFRYACSCTAIICLLQEATHLFRQKTSDRETQKESKSC